MTRRLSRLLCALMFVAAYSEAPAKAASAPTVMLETDLATFVFGGFAAHARVAPGRGHIVVGAGFYALDYPSFLVDLDSANRGAGWKVRLRLGGALFADYYFRPNAEGWFVGMELALQQFRYSNEEVPGESVTATNLVMMPRAGFQWQPFEAGFYLMPWLGLGYTTQISGERRLSGSSPGGSGPVVRTYDLSPFVPYAALHIGWKF
jgi:hypothetical protein